MDNKCLRLGLEVLMQFWPNARFSDLNQDKRGTSLELVPFEFSERLAGGVVQCRDFNNERS